MSKKHFIALADMLRGCKPNPENSQHGSPNRDYLNGRLAEWEILRDKLADFCQSQNYDFKRDRWIAYIAGECGKNGGAIKRGTANA